MLVGHVGHGVDVQAVGGPCAVVLCGDCCTGCNVAGGIGLGGEVGEHVYRAAVGQAVECELERLRSGVAKVLAQQLTPGFAGIHELLLMKLSPGDGVDHLAAAQACARLGNSHVAVAAVVGHKVVACCGIGVLFLHIVHSSALRFPLDIALAVKQQLAARAHHRHLWQVVGDVARELLAHGTAAEAEHVHLAQVAQAPFLGFAGRDLVHAVAAHLDFHPSARGQFRGVGTCAGWKCPCTRGDDCTQCNEGYRLD